jgi:hypothetical protein
MRNNNYNKELGNWIKNYSKLQYGEDFKLCVDLTYKFDIRNDKITRKWIKNLKNYINKNNYEIDGIFVNEYNGNYVLHNHLIVWMDCNWSEGKKLIFNYWKNIGSCNIIKYNSKLNYCNYITKSLDLKTYNNWDFINNL